MKPGILDRFQKILRSFNRASPWSLILKDEAGDPEASVSMHNLERLDASRGWLRVVLRVPASLLYSTPRQDCQTPRLASRCCARRQLVNKADSGNRHSCQQLLELARDAEAKENAVAPQDSALNDLDQEVLDGILKRFDVDEGIAKETNNDDQSP